MGCDIHAYREKFVGGKWVTADEWEPYDYGDDEKGMEVDWKKRAYHDRNYNLFGVLAGVRKRDLEFSLVPRRMPFDASHEVMMACEKWDSDGHSHSYLYLHELKALREWTRNRMIPISGMKHTDQIAALKASIASGAPNWDLLYPYCQGTNDPRQEEFQIEVPMDYILGPGLDKIIASFDGIDGENHRFVFWFDN